MKKIYLLNLSFLLCLFVNVYSQNVVVEIDGDDLYYSEPGCSDCWGDPDPRWRTNVTTNNGTYSWNVDEDEVCGWSGIANYSWVAPQVLLAGSSLSLSMDGWESDSFLCGADDNVCGGYTNVGSVTINSNPPCQWNYNTHQKVCGSGTYSVYWSYYWYYQSIDPGTISGDDTICAGDNPDTLQNILAGSTYANYQWQYSDDNGTTWNDITGETGLFYDPPAGLIATRWYRRMASSCGGVADTASNIVIVTVNPLPVATATPAVQPICSGDSTSIVLTSTLAGTTFTWTVTQTNSLGAFSASDSVITQLLTATGAIPDTAIYTIIPTTGLCMGDTVTAVVIVNPIPVATANPVTQTICSGEPTAISLTSNVIGTTFYWTVFQSGITGATLGSDTAMLSQVLTTVGSSTGAAIYSITPSANGCSGVPVNATTTVNPADDASFTYPSATFCQSGTDPTPTITGFTGGTFSAIPVGLAVNSTTGVINLASSTIGIYTLSYTTNGLCQSTSSITVTITNTNPSASFAYANALYCQNANNPLPVFNAGASAGIFSSVPAGLVFVHVNTGEIDLAASTPGTYIVTNIIPVSGTCLADTASTTIIITSSDNASFIYPSATYCISGPNQTPTITGLPGGIFSSTPVGLSLDSLTGTINLSASGVGAYTLSYTTNGACPDTSSITMTITNANPAANFSYIGAPFCQNGNDPFPLFAPGSSAGIFSATPAGLTFVHVNTGQIDLSASAPGTYTVTNTIPASGTCATATATTTITITPNDDASFVYSSATYCISGSNPTPVITGVPGGIFSSTPIGLALNPSTGTIDLANSALGSYTLTYTTSGSCPGISSITMTITNTTPSAMFSYTSPAFCQNGSNLLPVYAPGASAGIFSAIPVGLVFSNLNTGEIDLSSSAPGTYTVTNSIPSSGTCNAISASTTVIIISADDASFVYTSATYCQSGNNPTPAITGLSGGTFSAIPNGLSINPSTGEINLSASALGIYTLSYTTNGVCPNASSITMTIIDANPSATFSYAGSPFCQNTTSPFPTFAFGASAGIFSATPVGLIFAHVNTGEVDLSASAPGTYIVTNTIPQSGTCNAISAIDTVTINAPDDASFVYSSATYCTSGINPTPSITGLSGGVFSAIPPGLSINPSTGTINLSVSNLGTYTLSYTTNGSCPNASSITMTIINANPAATFTYSTASFCQVGSVFPVFATGASAGIFSVTPSGLVFVHVNTGEIDLAASTPGTYTVTNTIPVSGSCNAVSATTTITVSASDDASFTYSSATYCTSGTNPTPVITGLPGGTFSSSPVGLSINPSTGTINLFTSALGTYTLTYTTNGACPNSSSIMMTIADTTPSAFFSYIDDPYCQGAPNPLPAFVPGSSAGIFSATPAGLVFVNVNTGEIDLTASAAGTYNVINTIPASGSCDSATGTAVVIINPAPVITATPSPQTICIGGSTSITLSSSMGGTNCFWTVVETGVSGASAGTGPSITQTLNLTGNIPGTAVYTVTSTAGGCAGAPIDVIVYVNFLPVANISSAVTTLANCGNPTGGISGITMITGQPPFQYVWTDTLGTVVENNVDLDSVPPGIYTLTVTDTNGCTITAASFSIIATPPVIAQYTADTLIGQTPFTINFTNTSIGASNYLWDFGTGDTSNLINPVYTYLPLGQSTVCLTAISPTGCIDSICDTVDVFLNSVFVIPNVFTPNDDNINDIFTVQGVGLVKMDAEIYNRWGEKIFEWHTVNGGWSGRTSAGINASDGSYYYIIKASGIDGKEYFEKGTFILIRAK